MLFKRWQIIAWIVLLVTTTAASALTLGRVRGTALLGRSLDLSIQSTIEAGESLPEVSCVVAEVFYGDTRISPNVVSVIPERVSTGELRLRVRATTVVDEPVVTLFVRSTCSGSSSRRYVLLAEALSEPESGGFVTISPALTTPRPLATPLATPRIAFGGASSSSDQASAAASTPSSNVATRRAEREARALAKREERQQPRANASLQAQPRDVLPAEERRAVPRASAARKTDVAIKGSPRLQVDLLDVSSINLGLRGSAELASAPSEDEAVRRQAQALWRAINASPEEAMRDAKRLETVEAQMRAAQEQSKRQGQDIAKLSSDLIVAQDARYLNPLTIALGLLTIAAFALSLFLYRRGSHESSDKPWWRGSSAKNQPKDEQHLWKHLGDGIGSPAPGEQARSSDAPVSNRYETSSAYLSELDDTTGYGDNGLSHLLDDRVSQQPVRLAQEAPEPISVKPAIEKFGAASPQTSSRGGASITARASTSEPLAIKAVSPVAKPAAGSRNQRSSFGATDFAGSGFNAPRVVAAEELFDIQEQADFFLSLNQPEQAIEVLKNHIADNVETSALAYMDLFDIYHRTDRKIDYAELREEFNHVFNAQVPEFSQYGAQSNGLEDFPQVLGPIQAAWSRPHQAQDTIEESIFRQPERDQTLDMAAYRELMLLYALAKELTKPDAGYSMLPISTQIPAMPGIASALDSPDVDLGDGLMISMPNDALLSMDDRTVSLPPLTGASSSDKPDSLGGLDFDLSDSAALYALKPSRGKK